MDLSRDNWRPSGSEECWVITLKRICPNPMPWCHAFERLAKFAETHPCTPPSPPMPLILGAWACTDNVEKMHQWEDTVAWANNNGCREVVSEIPDHDFYVGEPTAYDVGPGGRPMYNPWDFNRKSRPSSTEVAGHFEKLQSRWSEIVGPELGGVTRPLAFTGKRARRLLIFADASACPPWGGWSHLSSLESDRRTFTRFRAVINTAIAPHEVDHVDFTTSGEPNGDSRLAHP